jgi:hypothetical protein
VRVIRVESIGATRIKIEAVSLDGEERLITQVRYRVAQQGWRRTCQSSYYGRRWRRCGRWWTNGGVWER